MAAGRSSRPRLRPRLRLHHWAALFISGLFVAHLLITWQSIQQEQVWSPESPVGQKLMRSLKVLLVESYMPRTRLDNRGSCPVADHVPKVALLFLATDGVVQHEVAWRAWFQGAEGLLPISQFEAGGLPPRLSLCAKALANSRGVPLSRQWLFSAYVHRPPNSAPLPSRHTFANHQITSTAEAAWGHHSVVLAARALLTAALKEPTNHKFQLLSGTTLPLWSPPVVYSRLMAESTSHLDACHHQAAVPAELAVSQDLQGVALRRSSPYFTLLRTHAALASHDTTWEPRFARACTGDEATGSRQTMCGSDEWYFPTLIAAAGQAGSTACHGGVVQDSWSAEDGAASRMEWATANVTAAHFAAIRSNNGRCQAAALLRSVLPAFQTVGALAAAQHGPSGRATTAVKSSCNSNSSGDGGSEHGDGDATGGACFLFARRFPDTTSQAVLRVLLDASSNLSIVQDPGEYDPRRRHGPPQNCHPPGSRRR